MAMSARLPLGISTTKRRRTRNRRNGRTDLPGSSASGRILGVERGLKRFFFVLPDRQSGKMHRFGKSRLMSEESSDMLTNLLGVYCEEGLQNVFDFLCAQNETAPRRRCWLVLVGAEMLPIF